LVFSGFDLRKTGLLLFFALGAIRFELSLRAALAGLGAFFFAFTLVAMRPPALLTLSLPTPAPPA
jgi:hypothetical protein